MNTKDLLIKIAKNLKQTHMCEDVDGSLPPVIIVENEDKITNVVIAPEVNKHMGIRAAQLLTSTVEFNSITLIMDTFAKLIPVEEREGFADNYNNGNFQQQYNEEGEDTQIRELLMLIRCDKALNISFCSIPYTSAKQKTNTPFAWQENDELAEGWQSDNNMSSWLSDELKKMIKKPAMDNKAIQDKAVEMNINPQDVNRLITRATVESLKMAGYGVLTIENIKEFNDATDNSGTPTTAN